MSVSRVVIPVLDLEQNDDPASKVVVKGAKQIATQRIKANGTASKSEVSFNFQPPSQNTVIDRRVDLVVRVKATLTGANTLRDKLVVANNAVITNNTTGAGALGNVGYPEAYLPQESSGAAAYAQVNQAQAILCGGSQGVVKVGNNLALRQFPLHSVIDNIDLTINGTHFSTDPAHYLKAVQQYTSPEYREAHFKNTAHHPDTYAGNYSDSYVPANYTDFAGCENSLCRENGKGRLGETPNGLYLNDLRLTADDATAKYRVDAGTLAAATTISFEIREPLMISPLSVGFGKGMTNINNIDVSVKFKSAFNHLFSFFELNGATTQVVGANSIADADFVNAQCDVVADSAFLEVRNFTAQDDIKIPNEIILPYHQPRRFETTIGTINAGVKTELQTASNRRLDQIPEAVYLWVARNRSELTAAGAHLVTDGMNQPTGVSITFGNQVGILSGYNEEQLFELAVENGCDLKDFTEARRKGYCLKLVFGKDIPLQDNESAGTRGDYNIQVLMSSRNGSKQNIVSVMNEMYVNQGQVIISPNECRVQTGLLDLKDNIDAENMGHHYALNEELTGAGLFSSLSKYAKKIPHLAKSVVKHAPGIVAVAKQASNLVKDPSMSGAMALGKSAMDLRKDMRGGSMVGGSMTGGSIVGGAYRSRRR